MLIQSSSNNEYVVYLLENKGHIFLDSVASLPNTNVYCRWILQNMHMFIVSMEILQNKKKMNLYLDYSVANSSCHILMEFYSGFHWLLVSRNMYLLYLFIYVSHKWNSPHLFSCIPLCLYAPSYYYRWLICVSI